MPSFNEIHYHTATNSPSPSPFDQNPRKSHDRNSVGNAFVWTPGPHGENGYFDPTISDHQLVALKNASLHSLTVPRSNASSYSRDRPLSKNESTPSLTSAPERDYARTSIEAVAFPGMNGQNAASGSTTPLANGASTQRTSQSLLTAPTTNGDHHRPSTEELAPTELPAGTTRASLSGDGSMTNGTFHDADKLSPTSPSTSQPNGHRYSSPPAPSQALVTAHNLTTSASPTGASGLTHRHTLQVPKPTTGRRNSRDNVALTVRNPSEDGLAAGGRFSPTSTGLRRASLSLARRPTRSIGSDHLLDEIPTDDDAARWAETIKSKRASRRRRREDEDDDRVIVGTKVDQHHVNYVTAYNMLTGIRFTVSRINAKMDRELTDADFEAQHKFSFDVTGNELTPSAKYDFKFKDYAPWVFRHLRAKFKIDPADYLMSLTSKYILSELGSPGKSGSFFYFSRDYKYIIKTIHHAEHKLLRRILRDYYQHIENNPNTLISQFYGLHRVKIAYGRKIHFVVMNNLFPPHRDIHQMFDLKGSSIGRDFREEDLEKNPRATLKDLNWLRRNRHLEVGPMKREVFLAQLRRDVALLQRLKIMDYSLLVGIHDINKGNEENLRDKTLQVFQPGGERTEDAGHSMLTRTPSKLENARKARELRQTLKREKPVPMQQALGKMPDEILDERKNLVFYSDDGGFRATHEDGSPGEEIYYLGVIDCLTHYSMTKKLETFFKGLSNPRTQISAIAPESYGERFLKFITAITMSKEEAERQQHVREQGPGSIDTQRTSHAFQRSSVDRTLERAQKEAVKSGRDLPQDPEPSDRVMKTVTTPSPDVPGGPPNSTLPVVEEIGEAMSTGGRSGASVNSRRRGSDTPDEKRDGDRSYPGHGVTKSPGPASGRDKSLPAIPQHESYGFPSPPDGTPGSVNRRGNSNGF